MNRTPSPFRGYVYPFGPKTTVGRIDQGQDFGGSGSIRAIGNAVVTKIGAPGWPGGKGIVYKLLDGPQRGRSVYVYEGVSPSVRVGQRVGAGQVIGQIIPGTSTGIETGWSSSAGVPLSHSSYTEGKETGAGKAFAQFLEVLKGKGAIGTKLSPGTTKEYSGIPGVEQAEQAGTAGEDAASAVANLPEHLAEMFASHAEALMLNIALIGGGAFLVYYGAALMLGVKKPVATPAKAAAVAATVPK